MYCNHFEFFFTSKHVPLKHVRTYVSRGEIQKVRIRESLIPWCVVLTFKLFKSCRSLYYLREMIHPGANTRICTIGITMYSCRGSKHQAYEKITVKSCARFEPVVVIYLRLFVFHAKLTMISIVVFVALLNYQRFYNIYFLVCISVFACVGTIWTNLKQCEVE